VSHEQLIVSLFGIVGGLLSWSIVRNIRAVDKNIEKLWERLDEIQEITHTNSAKIGVCESEIRSREWPRRK